MTIGPLFDPDDMPPLFARLGGKVDLNMVPIPHANALGIEVLAVRRNRAIMELPYQTKLIGDPETGVLHGGAITALLDNAAGLAVMCAIEEVASFATLDLRIDYMKPATPNQSIIGDVLCYKLTKNVAFIRGTAYHENVDDPVATAAAAFILKKGAVKLPGSSKVSTRSA